MRSYELTVNNNNYEINVDEKSPDRFVVEIDDKRLEVTLTSQMDAAQASITPGIESHVPAAPALSTSTPATKAPKVPSNLGTTKPRTPSPAISGGAGLAHAMNAPMPGVIVTINVAPGDTVNEGDVVMVLEAMKMKNDLHASQSGTIGSVDVSQGDQVKYGQTLLQFVKD